MRTILNQLFEGQISRRGFIEALAAVGISGSGIQGIIRGADAAEATGVANGRRVTGTGGELMVEQMKAAGVRYLFTNPGSFEVGFFDAFLDRPGIQMIVGLHEGIVIAMADGYHKVSGEPGFVNLHVIAGTAQAAGQLYNSSRDGSALVVTAGLLDNEVFSDDILLGARPGFNQKEVVRQFTRIAWEARESATLPMMLRRAFKVAATAPGGPVYLATPNYVLEKKGVSADIYDRTTFLLPNDVPADEKRITTLARALIETKRPVLFLGDEVAKSHAQPEAFALAELLALPVVESRLPAFHSFPRKHPLFTRAMPKPPIDLLLNVGGLEQGTGEFPQEPISKQYGKIARMSLNTEAVGRDLPFDQAIICNVKQGLHALVETVKSLATADRLAKIRADRPTPKAPPSVGAPPNSGQSPIHPDELAWAMDQELDRNAIIVSENLSGSNHYFSTGFRDNEKTWISNSGAGLGWGVGAATGAKLAAPNRQVVCDIGDGSVMYSASGFWTQARYEIPVLTIVCNNKNYQTVRLAYHRYGGKMAQSDRYVGMYLGDPDIDFVKLAESQGVAGVRIEKSADLRRALQRGIAATREGRPFLIEVPVQRIGGGAASTWHQRFSLAKS